MGASQIVTRLAGLPGWQLHGDGDELTIEKTFRFPSYLAALAFVNAVGFVAERQDHHPDVLLRYKSCSVRFRTHDVHGISAQDFACAALVDALLSAAA